MALVVETGAGLAGAESYLSPAGAAEYFTAWRPDKLTPWLNLSEEEKEALLRRATLFVDSNFNFRGGKSSPHQALAWPRDQLGIPGAIKKATAELVIAIMVGLDPLPEVRRNSLNENLSLGNVSCSISYAPGGGMVFPLVEAILRPLLVKGPKYLKRA